MVRIWHSNGQDSERFLALIDTGSSDSFICHNVVQDLKLGIREMSPLKIDAFDHSFTANQGVKPTWQFEKPPLNFLHPKRQEDFAFFVAPKLPGNIEIMLGNVVRRELGITLCASRKALIAHAYHGG